MQRLDDFMTEALTAYYNNNDPFGIGGDFTTAPEISQLFGEIIGIWAVQQWMAMHMPNTFNLIELGPGRGTLMNDLLRGTAHVRGFQDSMAIHLIETSPTLKLKQQKTLKNYEIQWHDHLSDVDNDTPCIIIANEFFDALPIQQFQFQNGAWAEHFIDNGHHVWQTTFDIPQKPSIPSPQDGDILEYSSVQQRYAQLMANYSGIFLIIDYGYTKSSYGDSLQAIHKHKPCDITDHVGEADLTSHVDYEWLRNFFQSTTVKTQRVFLRENGIDIRFQQLDEKALGSGYNRLIDPHQMGELFKVMEVNNFSFEDLKLS